jgi:hypothetical protein
MTFLTLYFLLLLERDDLEFFTLCTPFGVRKFVLLRVYMDVMTGLFVC